MVAVGLGVVTALFTSSAHAVDYVYSGSTGNFSTGFSPGGVTNPSAGYADTFSFGGSAAYTATDNLTVALQANSLTFTNGNAITLSRSTAASTKNSFTLGNNGTLDPIINFNQAGGLAINLDLVLNATTTFNGTNAGGAAVAGIISGTGGINVNTSGTMMFAGAETYTGTTQVQAGNLVLPDANSGLNGTKVIVASGASLTINEDSSLSNVSMTISGTGATGQRGALQFTAGTSGNPYTLSSPIKLDGDTTIGQLGSQDTIIFAASITGTGNLTFAPEGTSSASGNSVNFSLGKANTYAGNTTFGSGKTQSSATYASGIDNALPTTTGLTLNAQTGVIQLNLNGHNQTLASLSAAGTLANDTVANTSGTAGTLTINNAVADTFGGKLGTATAGANFALAKTGAGTLTLTGANVYSGSTTVSAGTLLVDGTNSGIAAVTVNNSGTILGGTGSVAGDVTVNSGAGIQGGDGTATGALTLARSLTLGSGSVIELALGASGAHSTLSRTGSGGWTFGDTQAFTFINLGAQPVFYNNIITGLGSTLNTSVSGWTITNKGFAGTFSFDGANIDLTLTAVPISEPATVMGGALMLGALGWKLCREGP